MARRRKFVGLIAAATAIAGVALYIPNSPFFNGSAFGAGYGTVCPVGLTLDVTPSVVTYGGAITQSGQLVSGGPGSNVAGEHIQLHRVRRGTSTVSDIINVTTDSNGFFSVSVRPYWSAFYGAEWGAAGCSTFRSGDTNQVRVRMTIVRSAATVSPGQVYTLSGTVKFAHPGGYIVLQSFKQGSSTINTRTITLDSTSAWSFRSRNFARGTYWFRAIFPSQDADHLGAHTVWVPITVS
jgi:hypothetical protein